MDIMGLMKKAGAMQAKMAEMQAELDNITVEGLAGGGLVKVTLTAKGALQALVIDPSLLKEDEKEILEDLIVAAHADAKKRVEEVLQSKMQELAGGLQLPPGLKLF